MRRRQVILTAVLALLCSGLSPIGAPAVSAASSPATTATRESPKLAAPPEPNEPSVLPHQVDRALKNPKADWQVAAVVDSVSTSGAAAALGEARAHSMTVSGSGIRVIVEASDLAKAASSVTTSGAALEATAGNLIQVLATPAELSVLLSAPGISYVRVPFPHAADAVTGQGIESTNASSLQALGNTGAGVKVAVIDLGFSGLASAQANGDVPYSVTTVDYCSGGFSTVTQHGTAVAEIVHEMAPGAQLYLICIGTEVQLAQAEAYAKANGIQIVNHSVAWYNTSRGDGSGSAGTPDAIVADANANGLLWVNSAGNDAQTHWSGNFVDNGFGWNLFVPGSDYNQFYLPAGTTMCSYLKWDGWPTTVQDYDLYVAQSSDGTIVAGSENSQTGTQPPIESTCYTNSTGASQYFLVAIRKYSTTAAPRFDLFVYSGDADVSLQYQVAAGSVVEPASSSSAFAAGAVCWQGTTIEPFSSKGPTIDGRTKPDLSGPDGVSSFTYGTSTGCNSGAGFYGTSAAAPHVAGAAALVKSANPTFTVAQIKSYLLSTSRDLGVAGQDNVYGSGLLFLPTAPGKPLNLAASAGDAAVGLTWTTPGNGGSAITGYTVTETEHGLGVVTCSMTGATSCTISGLTNATEYTFTVHATNSFGPGPESDPSNKVTPHVPTVPGKPTSVSATASAGSALVSWTAPVDDGASSITSYAVTSSPDGKICTTTGSLSCSLSGLTNGTSYTFTVIATNGVGPGPASDPSMSVTPLAGATYHAITPARVLDTRNGTGGLWGPLTNHAARTFVVTGGSSGVPPSAIAVTGNLTVTGQASSGYLSLGPIATNDPGSSTLNFPVADDRANAVTVALGVGGTLSITFVAPSTGPTANAIFDVTGYFTPDATGATYLAISPTRALDTRSGIGLSGPFTNHAARTFAVAGVPAGAIAVTGNLTVTGQTSSGYLFIGPIATNNPGSSSLNFPVADDRANAVTVALGAGGTLSITFVAPSNGPSAQAIFDVTGYFTGGASGASYVPLTPTRNLDTRNGTGGLSGPFTNHAARTFGVSGVPSTAVAVTGNLTVTGQTSSGYLYIGPVAMSNPTGSTLNFPVGDDRANAVTVALSGGTLSITFVAPSNGPTAQGILDVTGYFVR